jgi:IclR family transcriptional regulator, acetate operon repressor
VRRWSYLDERGLKKLTPKTITKRSVLEKVLAQIRASRLSIEREEFTAGLCCMAVPIADTGDTYALGISVPLEGFDMNVESYKLAMHRVASQRSEY